MKSNDLQEAIKKVDKKIVPKEKNKAAVWIPTLSAAVICVCVVTLSLSGAFKKKPTENNAKPKSEYKNEYADGVIGEKKTSKNRGGIFDVLSDIFEGKKTYDGALMAEEPVADGIEIYEAAENTINAKAGTLTAGEHYDLGDIDAWKKLVNENEWYKYAENRNIFSNNIIKVTVKSGDAAVFNAKVTLKEGDNVLYNARTNVSGEAFLLYNINAKNQKPDSVEVEGETYQLDGKTEITVDAKAKDDVKALDFMLMIDTTGSMGDELRYITEELKDIVARVAKCDEKMSIRVSVNFYRDVDDDYVVKYFDFRENIDECIKQLSDEFASGGGDFPEAVHTALDNAVNGHQWRDNAVKICFIVLDAPPHSEEEVKGINKNLVESLAKAAENGIRIVPVMCSGADQETEYTLRSFAVLTGGTFVFLTDDSGVGNPHQEVTVPDYSVEKLNDCMVRITCEFCGLKYETPERPVPTENSQQNQQQNQQK